MSLMTENTGYAHHGSTFFKRAGVRLHGHNPGGPFFDHRVSVAVQAPLIDRAIYLWLCRLQRDFCAPDFVPEEESALDFAFALLEARSGLCFRAIKPSGAVVAFLWRTQR
jgi:hypothetical protein